VLPDLVPDMQRTTLQATVYSGDRCRRGDAQSLALTIEVDFRKSALQVESGGFTTAGAVGVSVIDPARGAERLIDSGISGRLSLPRRSTAVQFHRFRCKPCMDTQMLITDK
jgi:hypothetical protein